uniref:Endothelin-1 n=1 Tax=Pavo cristatus TaxID=9049 RepID=A0A8C9FKM2_PAVCR
MGVRYKRAPGTAAPARRAVPPRAAACPRAPPPAGATEVSAASPQPPAAASHRRDRRCSCSSLLDEECVYFCHLDIIWINTPEKTVPYGLGGPSRSRRSLKDIMPEMLAGASNRCRCASQRDKKCLNFCQTGKDLWAQSTAEKTSRHRNKAGGCTGPKCMNQQFVDSRKMKSTIGCIVLPHLGQHRLSC